MCSSEDAKLCLISSSKRPDTLKKLNMIGQTMDGQTLISNDLKSRGEGANLGFDKWGFASLNLVNISEDEAIISTANQDSQKIIKDDLKLASKDNNLLRFEISRVFED